ncbi:hypothetical protein RYZ26_04450 [Terasakiella sp. A23]|uniref:hypothetical protein n=1 Tax=Terasakiella sp. FCG-A23 TaxID=3080561 RepID=UPI00295296D2|nr:hypothetical protein [Terasakiella sp. A23]MDV7338828.1 hypothetical protein [Terasakiella sp. A23]
MSNLPEIAALIIFILAGRLFLTTFKHKKDGWKLKCIPYLAISLAAFAILMYGFFPE